MTRNRKLNIAIVDDHAWLRDGLRMNLAKWPHGRVVLEAADGLEYERKCAKAPHIDIAIVDLSMPNRDGFETVTWIQEYQPGTMTLVITGHPTADAVHHALLAGAGGILEKKDDREELYTALDHLRATRRYHNELVQQQLTHTPDPGSPLALRKKAEEELTPTLLRFLFIYTGDDNPTIAETAARMDVEEDTAEGYRKEIGRRTGARTRADMVKFRIRFGLLKER